MTEQKYAHELYPYPDEGEVGPAIDRARYHYAQAQAFCRSFEETVSSRNEVDSFACYQMIHHSELGFLYDALSRGLGGQEAAEWAMVRSHGEALEMVGDRIVALGVDWEAIKPYETQVQSLIADRDEARGTVERVKVIVDSLGDTDAPVDALALREDLDRALTAPQGASGE